MSEDSSITLQDLLKLRRATSAVAGEVEKEIRAHLDVLATLIRPKLLLGDYISGASTESRPDAEASFKKVSDLFAEVAPRVFRLRPRVEKPLPGIRVRLDLHPLEEPVSVGDGGHKLTIVSPFSWVVSYPGACSLGSLRKMLSGEEERNEGEIRQFVLNSCILHLLIERSKNVIALLEALRFELRTEKLPGLGELPVPVIRSVIPTTRPSAQVMVDAADLAGQSLFSEVIDVPAARAIPDPLQLHLEAALAE